MWASGGGEKVSSERQGSRGRPKKQVNKNQGDGGEGSRGGAGEGSRRGGGEGYQEERGEEPDNNNDPNCQPPSPSRKRPHSGDREEGGGGGGDDEGGVRHIAAQVPVNNLEITAGLAVMEKMSVRQHLMFLSGVLRACGVDLNELLLSLSSAQRYRVYECERLGDTALDNFVQEVEEDEDARLVVHFDGKILNHDMGGKTGTAERLVTLVNGPLVKKAQPLAATPMKSSTGYETAVTVSQVLAENRQS